MPALVAPAPPPVTTISLNQVLDQDSSTTCLPIPESDYIDCLERYEKLFGAGQRPPQKEEPSSEQLSCLKHVLDNGENPYVDLAIFGPHSNRFIRKQRMDGLRHIGPNQWVPQQYYGPADFHVWLDGYCIYKHCLLMLDAVDLGVLNAYQALMVRYHNL